MNTATYTGPERRWMTRSLYTWQDRHEHHDQKFARDEARSIAILEKIRARAVKRHRSEEADALFDGIWEIRKKLEARRARIAEKVAPWFDNSAFRRCTCYVLPHAEDCGLLLGITQSGQRVYAEDC